jgi:hypothetical protein
MSRLTRVAAALSKQVARDFGPIWSVDATVDAYASLEDVPIDYWPIILVSEIQGAAGYHMDKSGQPYALVETSGNWALTASHECLEMLADPFGSRLRAGNLLDQAIACGLKPARVRYLVEVCDPSEAAQFAYQVNGILVSDFYTPRFFDPVKAPDVTYSFTGHISTPRTVLPDGYITWQDMKTKHWMQLRMFPDRVSTKLPHVVDLNTDAVFSKSRSAGQSLRAAVDRVTKNPGFAEAMDAKFLSVATERGDAADEAQIERAAELRQTIVALKRAANRAGTTPAKKLPAKASARRSLAKTSARKSVARTAAKRGARKRGRR